MSYNTGHIALANNTNYRPTLINFHGYEGEDFRHFLDIMESYFALSNISNDARKLLILKAQLRGPAKVYYEKNILKNSPEIKYDEAVTELKNHYITPELIQSYELEFNEMYQGEQEHPQIFLARLREAADLANIDNEAVIESRFRAGLLRDIKQFCIQSSSKTMKDWINHAEGWWNANRPRKIAMVDNPFIPRNANQALIYQNENMYPRHQLINNHNIELIDPNEPTISAMPVYNAQNTTLPLNHVNPSKNTLSLQQLTALDVTNHRNHVQSNNFNGYNHANANQQGLVELIQQTICQELNNQPQYRNSRYNNYNRTGRYDNNDNSNNRYNNYRRPNDQPTKQDQQNTQSKN